MFKEDLNVTVTDRLALVKLRLWLNTPDQLRALSDPLRLRIIELLIGSALPVTDLARALGVPTTRLYHHVDLLLAGGLIEVVSEIRRRGVEERVFRAAARRYQLGPNLVRMGTAQVDSSESVRSLARSVLGGALRELIDGVDAGRVVPAKRGRGLVLEGRQLRLPAAAFESLAKKLPAWLDGFARRQRGGRGGPGGEYRIVLAAFPVDRKRSRSRGSGAKSTRRRSA
jgi:DNA-binding transcriptional ArsR family regulator